MGEATRAGRRRKRLAETQRRRWIRDRLEPHESSGVAVLVTKQRHQALRQQRLAGALAQVRFGASLQAAFAVFAIRVSRQIAEVIFDHPERRNAITVTMWREIPEITVDLDRDDSVRVIVLRGAGEMHGGPPPFQKKDRSRFLQQLDQLVHEIRRAREST